VAHVAVEWAPDHITYFLDGVPQFTNTDPAATPDGPMHVAIQNDVGPYGEAIPARDASTPAEVAVHVDWVRIYRSWAPGRCAVLMGSITGAAG
jgi:beta-glucanase (GH16 family)